MAATEYASLAEFRTWPGIPASGADTLLQQFLDSAAARVDEFCASTFGTSAVAATLTTTGNGRTVLELPLQPVVSVTSVALAGVSLSSEYWIVDQRTGLLTLLEGHRFERNQAVVVEYTYGHVSAEIPQAVSLATLRLAAAGYKAAKSQGKTAEALGPRSVQWNHQTFDAEVEGMLAPYVQARVGV